MTSVLPEEESNVTRLKHKSQPHGVHSITNKSCNNLPLTTSDETRAFLTFSRENLSISHSDLEQGFNKPHRYLRCCSKQTLLSCVALTLALFCSAFELWKFKRVTANARDIESLRREVETLKHRFLEKDLLDELRTFEEQLYSEGLSEEEELTNLSSSSLSDYDTNYDESPAPSLFPSPTPNSEVTTSSSGTFTTTQQMPCTSKDLEEVLAVLRRAESERGEAFERSVREREKMIEDERLRELRRMAGEHRVKEVKEKNKRDVEKDFYTRLKKATEK